MEDWRYEGLRQDIQRLEKELRETEGRTFEVQQWQRLLPIRVTEAVFWLITASFIIFSLAAALARST
jgi:hypothetical protein